MGTLSKGKDVLVDFTALWNFASHNSWLLTIDKVIALSEFLPIFRRLRANLIHLQWVC